MLLRIAFVELLFRTVMLSQGVSTSATAAKLPEHAIVAALGDASVIFPGSSESAGINPANAFRDDGKTSISFTHTAWIQDVSGQRLSAAFSLPLGRLAFGIASTTVGGIEIRDIPGPPLATFDAHTAVIRAAWAVPVLTGIVAGIGASYVYEKIYVDESSGYGFDVGLLASTPIENLSLGGSLTQVGSLRAFRKEQQDLPTTLRLGVQYSIQVGDYRIQPVIAWGSQTKTSRSALTIAGGLTYNELVSIRASWKSAETAQNFSVGAGVTVEGISAHLGIVPFASGLGTGQVFSISLTF